MGQRRPMNSLDEQHYREHHQRRFSETGRDYNYYHPGYAYGHEMGTDPRYQSHDWGDIEHDAQVGFERRYDDLDWAEMRECAREGYHHARTGGQGIRNTPGDLGRQPGTGTTGEMRRGADTDQPGPDSRRRKSQDEW